MIRKMLGATIAAIMCSWVMYCIIVVSVEAYGYELVTWRPISSDGELSELVFMVVNLVWFGLVVTSLPDDKSILDVFVIAGCGLSVYSSVLMVINETLTLPYIVMFGLMLISVIGVMASVMDGIRVYVQDLFYTDERLSTIETMELFNKLQNNIIC